MKILHVIPGLAWERGGPSAVIRALVGHQARRGHQVSVLTTDQGVRHGQTPMNLPPAVALDQLRVLGPDRVAYSPGFARAVRSRLRDCDVAHVHSIFTSPIHVTLREADKAGIPVVLRPCGHLHRYSLSRSRIQKSLYLRLWGRMVRRACTAWHYTSDNEAEESWPWDESPRFTLANGIEPEDFALERGEARSAVFQSVPALRQAPYVLFLGRISAKKRLDFLVDSFLAGAPRHYRLIVAGPEEGMLWRAIDHDLEHDPGKQGRVIRLNTVTGALKAQLLAGATLFALSSEHENFGIAPLEALAAGTPVVLSPAVGLTRDAVAAGVGFSVPLERKAWAETFASLRSWTLV